MYKYCLKGLKKIKLYLLLLICVINIPYIISIIIIVVIIVIIITIIVVVYNNNNNNNNTVAIIIICFWPCLKYSKSFDLFVSVWQK